MGDGRADRDRRRLPGRRVPPPRSPATGRPLLGLGLYLWSCLVLALAVGWGRASWELASVERSRYAAAAVPTLLCLYFIWEACGPPRVRPFGRAALCGLVFAFLALNAMKGVEEGRSNRDNMEEFQADVRAGMPIPEVISRSGVFSVHDQLEDYLRLLRDRRYGDYASLPADPPFREVP